MSKANKSKNKQLSEPNPKFVAEYKKFVRNYLLRLFGVVGETVKDDVLKLTEDVGGVVQKEKTLFFSAGGWRLFRVNLRKNSELTEVNVRLANRVVEAFLKRSRYKWNSSGVQNAMLTPVRENDLYNMIIQEGICGWIIDHSNSKQIQTLFSVLEKWSVKTYEGKSVTLGFVIDPKTESEHTGQFDDWLDFMKDDFVAVLTDCIHSVIELDRECRFVQYLSVSENDRFESFNLSPYIPIRFTQIIQRYVTGEKVGVFLLSNGDIVLAKNQEVCFVKRNLQWLNLSYPAFYNSLNVFRKHYKCDDKLIQSIYASVLDVSFSHAGGIISVVGQPWNKAEVAESLQGEVLNECDNLQKDISCEELYQNLYAAHGTPDAKIKNAELKKRLLKRNFLTHLVGNRRFYELDRKLRGELIALDGACILDCKGDVYSFGAIIRNESGSSGGGRGAAAKKLSSYGMAIKISTDGYIEVYVNRELVYEIK